MRARRLAAFTLVEVLVTVAIVALLATLAVPLAQRALANGRATACVSNLRQIGMGLSAYLGEHDATMPKLAPARASLDEKVDTIDTALAPYVTRKEVFACPADAHFAQLSGTSYFWNFALNGQRLATLNFLQLSEAHSLIPVLSDKEGFHPYLDDKVNVLYADGHASKELKFSIKR